MSEGMILKGRVVALMRERSAVWEGAEHKIRSYKVATSDFRIFYVDVIDGTLDVDPETVLDIPIYVNAYFSEKKQKAGFNLRYSEPRAA